jgi:hypothetical protein
VPQICFIPKGTSPTRGSFFDFRSHANGRLETRFASCNVDARLFCNSLVGTSDRGTAVSLRPHHPWKSLARTLDWVSSVVLLAEPTGPYYRDPSIPAWASFVFLSQRYSSQNVTLIETKGPGLGGTRTGAFSRYPIPLTGKRIERPSGKSRGEAVGCR